MARVDWVASVAKGVIRSGVEPAAAARLAARCGIPNVKARTLIELSTLALERPQQVRWHPMTRWLTLALRCESGHIERFRCREIDRCDAGRLQGGQFCALQFRYATAPPIRRW
jgi:hypothetical protein